VSGRRGGASAGLTFVGFMHGEAIGVGQSPVVTASYVGVAIVLFLCAKFATVTARQEEPHETEAHAVAAAE
jgi:AGZA family xanthine/uracil permease-like MFS transporter